MGFDETNEKNTESIREVLASGRGVRFSPQGTSMYPLFVSPKDEATVIPVSFLNRPLKRADVCLYERGDRLIIHRIVKTSDEGIFFAGDHQTDIEGPLSEECVLGVMTAFVRKGHKFGSGNIIYKLLSRVWLALLPNRTRLIAFGSKVKGFFLHKKKQM